jgi:hypothetical protein
MLDAIEEPLLGIAISVQLRAEADRVSPILVGRNVCPRSITGNVSVKISGIGYMFAIRLKAE